MCYVVTVAFGLALLALTSVLAADDGLVSCRV